MQGNPAEDWQELTEVYRLKSDEELNELAQDFADLTPTAREVLRGAMKGRGLDDPLAPRTPSQARFAAPEGPREEPLDEMPLRHTSTVDPDGVDRPLDENKGGEEEDRRPREYTWKTPLCECEDRDHAWQVTEALRRAGIESWIEQPGRGWVIGGPRVVVAADQLEQARAVVAQPIPQDIVDQSKMEVPEFVPPKCPVCGAEDPVLEGAEPANSWLCEACGKQWTEPVVEADGEIESAGR